MKITRTFLATGILGVSLLWSLSSCAHPDFTALEDGATSTCFIDNGAWPGDESVKRYVENSFWELHEEFPDFLDNLDRAARSERSQDQMAARFDKLHIEAGTNIVRLGRLLPRMERAMDFPPMIEQMRTGEIWWPRSDQHGEFLRVALAEEFVDHQHLHVHLAEFLVAFEKVEGLLLALKTDPARTERRQLIPAIATLRETWESAEAMGMVIFDRPHMPVGESLSERLQLRVQRICVAYNACAGERDTCGGGEDHADEDSGSSDFLDEPMEDDL